MTPVRPQRNRRYVPVVGPKLKRLLAAVFGLFALLVVNSAYLLAVTIAGVQYQNWFYLNMFLVHLALGLLIIVPVIAFGFLHIRNAWTRPNRRAIRAGMALFITANVVLITGIVLMRVDVLGLRLELNNPVGRSAAYWAHVICPVVAIWLFILHRLAGRRIKWRIGLTWGAVAAVFALVMLWFQMQDPRAWNEVGNAKGVAYFEPSLARTVSGDFIPERVLNNDQYCEECHAEVHRTWSQSAHRFASFNNPAYLFAVRETRRFLFERDGTVHGSRFCAGCHDVVPFFSGAFDSRKFDDLEYDLANDPSAQAGLTCTACHAISHVGNSTGGTTVLGNADYTIDVPIHYPFTFSDNRFLRWVNRQLVKAKPAFHKATFLKPLHRSPEFCGTCHKVHLPEAVNAYKWLRGQDHYGSFWLSGVSGQGVGSFYYPPQAEENCAACHMPLMPASEFGAKDFAGTGVLTVHDHMFPAANTALPYLRGAPDWVNEAHHNFLAEKVRVDIFGIKEGGTIDATVIGPLRPVVPALQPGQSYLIETVIRTVGLGHLFTQGTSDSNQIWMDVTVRSGDRVIGRSGGRRASDNAVDPWSHLVNSFIIDREGNRINRRNAQDIFVALYNNQIPPGAADVVHYLLHVPADVTEPIEVEVKLQYRKFDTEYMRLVTDDDNYANDLPITTLAHDTVVFAIAGLPDQPRNGDSPVEAWERWNDYGIGLLRKGGGKGELRQARYAFEQVERLGRPDGPLNLARVYINEGLVQTHAQEALRRATNFIPPANEWSLLWFGAQVATRNGDYDRTITNLRDIIRGGFAQAQGRGYDFSKDYRVLNELGAALYQRGLRERGEVRRQSMDEARQWYDKVLTYDPENIAAHWGLKQVYRDLGNLAQEQRHAKLHAKYKPDDNARDEAVAKARIKYPAANHAAEAIVIYDVQRPGAYDLPVTEVVGAPND